MLEESLWNSIRLLQPDGGFRLSTDSVLVANFMSLPNHARVCDLGAGCGSIGLLLCARSASVHVTGVELQPDACRLAEQNIALNSLQDRFCVHCADLRKLRGLLPAANFDCVVSNPPYFQTNAGGVCADPSRAIARTELCCTLEDLCQAAAMLLRWGGSFALVHRPERLCDLIWQFRQNGIEPKRIRFVRHTQSSPVCLVLLEGRRGAKAGLSYEPDLIQFAPDGSETAEYRAIYHH